MSISRSAYFIYELSEIYNMKKDIVQKLAFIKTEKK